MYLLVDCFLLTSFYFNTFWNSSLHPQEELNPRTDQGVFEVAVTWTKVIKEETNHQIKRLDFILFDFLFDMIFSSLHICHGRSLTDDLLNVVFDRCFVPYGSRQYFQMIQLSVRHTVIQPPDLFSFVLKSQLWCKWYFETHINTLFLYPLIVKWPSPKQYTNYFLQVNLISL